MLRSRIGLHAGVGRSHARPCMGVRASRPVRQPRLGVCAFKDWFTGLVQQQQQQHKEPQQQQPQPQQGSQTAVQEPQLAVAPAQAPPQPPAPKVAPKRDFLEARQVSLFQLFDSSDFKFDIPTYQRPYAWGTKQIYELLQDFVKAYETRQEYFLGAIVATRAADGSNVPYQLIDGQQRLTSLVLLLSYLHGWARQQGNEGLEGRIRRMLYMEADPLDAESNGRYRLRLRDADDEFFRTNVLDSFLPQQYRLSGLAAAADVVANGAAAGDGGSVAVAAAEAEGKAEALPLENETWWRLYENSSFLRGQLDKLVAEGLNLQDFAFHVLRNCFVVLMVARDEGASFRIFSTLNGRGMDLSVVDKLKADLLAGELTPAERTHFAGAWAEMESVLGRAAFHRVFDYMRELAAVRDPAVRETSVLEYFTRRVDDPAAVKQVLQVALDYARLLLQLRQASWATPELAALLAETPAPPQTEHEEEEEAARGEAVAAVVAAVLEHPAAAPVLAPEEEGRLLEQLHAQHRQWQEDGGAASGVAAAVEGSAAEEPQAFAAAEAAMSGHVDGARAALEAKPAAEEEGGVVVFRFDDPAAASVAAVAATADEVSGVESLPAVEASESERGAPVEAGELSGDALAASATSPEEAAPESGAASVALASVGLLSAAGAGVAESVISSAAVAEEEQQEALGVSNPEPVRSDVELLEASVAAAASSAAAAFEELRAQLLQQQQQELSQDEQLQQQPTQEAAAAVVVGGVAEGVASALDPVIAERQRQAELLAELDARSRHLNLFSDEAWLPPLLEFFYQTDDLSARVAFMKSAEALQLLLELQGDPATKAARWGRVSDALLQRPFRPQEVLAALRLTDAERETFRARLDSKDLYGTADQRTLRHLLVRCEPPSVCRSLSALGLGGLYVERVVPQSAPEGSTWRKTRISSPCDPQSSWPELRASAQTAAATPSSDSASSSPSPQQPEPSAAAAAAVPTSYEVKYWYELQRLNWHGKLGNLLLLPATAAGAASATADYDVKAALWRQAGVAARLPGFTGPVVDDRGRYGRFRFCHDECRQRHADMLGFLIAEFEL